MCRTFLNNSVRNGSVGRKEGHFITIGTGFRRHQPIMCRDSPHGCAKRGAAAFHLDKGRF